MVTCLLPRAPAKAWFSRARRGASFSSASENACTREGRRRDRAARDRGDRPRLPATRALDGQQQTLPVGVHNAESTTAPAAAKSSAYLRSASPAISRSASQRLRLRNVVGGASVCFDDAVAAKTRNAPVGQIELDGIRLLAHGVGHHQKPAANTRRLSVPCDGVEGRHADEPHFERRGDALRRRHGDAHAREGTRPRRRRRMRCSHARRARSESSSSMRASNCVRRPASLHLRRGDARDALGDAVDQADADGDDPR